MQVIDAPASPRVDARARPLAVHAGALLLVLVALVPIVGTHAVFSADEGAALLQTQRVLDEGTWVGQHPLPELDPAIAQYPVHLAEETADGWHELTRHPGYIWLLVAATAVAGTTGAVALSILATVLAAFATGVLAERIRPGTGRATLWTVGLASPLLFDSYLVIAHSLGAAFAALAALALVGRPRRWPMAAGAIGCAGTVLMRSEGLFLGLALGAALLITGVSRRDEIRRRAGLVATSTTVGAFLIDGWWTDALKAPTTGSAGTGIGRFQGGLVEGRWEGFERTWLWVGRTGLPAGSELILIGVVLAVFAAVAVRRQMSAPVITVLSALSAACIGIRLLVEGSAVVPGLLFAFPLLTVGGVLIRRRHLDEGDGATGDLVLAAVLYSAAVIATQYSVGGTTEWGGRYFALGLPLIVPVLVMAVQDGLRTLDPDLGRRWLASLLVVSLGLSAMGVLGLRRTHDRTSELVDTIAAGIAVAGPEPVVVTDVNPLARWAWPLVDDARWVLFETADVEAMADELARAGIDSFVYVGFLADDQIATLTVDAGDTTELVPAFDDQWRVVVVQ